MITKKRDFLTMFVQETDNRYIYLLCFCHIDNLDIFQINQLKSYTDGGGSMFDLAPPEQLLLLLGSIPGYRLQLDTAVFHSDFNDNFFRLNEAFEVLLKACKDTVNCDKLRDFMEFCMRVGNFLNKVKLVLLIIIYKCYLEPLI